MTRRPPVGPRWTPARRSWRPGRRTSTPVQRNWTPAPTTRSTPTLRRPWLPSGTRPARRSRSCGRLTTGCVRSWTTAARRRRPRPRRRLRVRTPRQRLTTRPAAKSRTGWRPSGPTSKPNGRRSKSSVRPWPRRRRRSTNRPRRWTKPAPAGPMSRTRCGRNSAARKKIWPAVKRPFRNSRRRPRRPPRRRRPTPTWSHFAARSNWSGPNWRPNASGSRSGTPN